MEKRFKIPIERKIALFLITFIALLVFLGVALNLYTEFLWFRSLNLDSVFIAILYYKVTLFVIFFIIAFVLFSLNRLILQKASYEFLGESYRLPFWVDLSLALVVAFLFSHMWIQYVYFINSVDFNLKDPIFGLDISFYVFKLPFIQTILFFFLTLIILAILVSAAYYASIFK